MAKGTYSGLLQATFVTPGKWLLKEDLSFTCDNLDEDDFELFSRKGANAFISEKKITAPAGLETNLASIPRPLWALISPTDLARSSVIHDYLYGVCINTYPQNTEYERKQMRAFADQVFLEAMKSAENPTLPKWKIYSAYYAVRWFGFAAARPKDHEEYENKGPVERKHDEHEEEGKDNWHNEGGANH